MFHHALKILGDVCLKLRRKKEKNTENRPGMIPRALSSNHQRDQYIKSQITRYIQKYVTFESSAVAKFLRYRGRICRGLRLS